MTTEEIPQFIIDYLDAVAGQPHSRNGRVLTALAQILTMYDEWKENESNDDT